jgi:hypothetical protein
VTPDDTSEARFAATIVAVALAIGVAYGHRLSLAAASKRLWVTFRHPFIIYERVVRPRLATRHGVCVHCLVSDGRRGL